VLINFWATWCAPCKIETPWLIELRNRYAAQGFEVLGISADDLDPDDKQKLSEEKKEIARFAEQMHIPYPVLIDGDSLSTPYDGLDALPVSYLWIAMGRLLRRRWG
jgi:thiol-disulfide isomerase/thioredoxin